jgi:hypothetical protein
MKASTKRIPKRKRRVISNRVQAFYQAQLEDLQSPFYAPLTIAPQRDGYCINCRAIRLSIDDSGGLCLWCREEKEKEKEKDD